MDKARDTAAKILLSVHEQGAYSNVALARELRRNKLTDVDRRFVTELVYGAVKAGDTLDWILRRYASRPLKKIPPMVREILRLGIYQLFYMDKVPSSAVCNEAVELTKKYSHVGTTKFVNAVLRAAVRSPEKAGFPEGKTAERLALESCHPLWLMKRWIQEFGYEGAKSLCDFDNAPPVLSVRANTLRTSREKLLLQWKEEGMDAIPSPWAPEGILCQSHGALDELAALQQGLCQVQDESSMLVAHVLAPRPGETILDACSAPGGKATHMAALMENWGKIIACDIYEHKLQRIEENARRLGIDIIETRLMDAREISGTYEGQADRVLVDAPCSGLGVLRRKPDARWKKKPQDLEALPVLQLAILRSASRAVRPGGVLVYSTCTMGREENQKVVEDFLKECSDFRLDDTGKFLPERARPEQMLQLFPQKDGTDGFFIARMSRAG